jgi:hypothetical protein
MANGYQRKMTMVIISQEHTRMLLSIGDTWLFYCPDSGAKVGQIWGNLDGILRILAHIMGYLEHS